VFPKNRGFVSSLYVGGFIASGVIYEILHSMYNSAGATVASFRGLLLGLAGTAALFAALMAWMMPGRAFLSGDHYGFMPRRMGFRVESAQEWAATCLRRASGSGKGGDQSCGIKRAQEQVMVVTHHSSEDGRSGPTASKPHVSRGTVGGGDAMKREDTARESQQLRDTCRPSQQLQSAPSSAQSELQQSITFAKEFQAFSSLAEHPERSSSLVQDTLVTAPEDVDELVKAPPRGRSSCRGRTSAICCRNPDASAWHRPMRDRCAPRSPALVPWCPPARFLYHRCTVLHAGASFTRSWRSRALIIRL
jgi:hypothetical protein